MPVLDFEKIKQEGLEVDFLKVTKEGYEALRPEDHYRVKTYGLCAQRHEGYFMIRIRIPGGVMRSEQLEKIASLAERYGHGWGHLTTRGNIELHSVKINDFLTLRQELAEVGITTRSSCGHTFRNILGCPRNGVCPKQDFDLYPWVIKIHQHVFERADFYNRRLPRRLNVSFSGCEDCSADAQINDVGLAAKKISSPAGERLGFALWVAGSLGTAPRMGYLLKEFMDFEEVLPSLEAITELYCLHGERRNAAKARLKFLVENWGIEKFRAEFEKLLLEIKAKQARLPEELRNPPLLETASQEDGASPAEGVHSQRQAGFYRVEFWVPLGELTSGQMMHIAARSREFGDGRIYHTTRQNFELHFVRGENLSLLLRAMQDVGFGPVNSESILNVVACPGTSFCSLAVTSSQGAAKVLMKELDERGVAGDSDLRDLTINISGCPNSCAKHQVADIGFSGGMTDVGGIRRFGYQLYVGGKFNGSVRSGTAIKKGIPDDRVFPTTQSVLEVFKEQKLAGEKFPDFVDRFGAEALAKLVDERLAAKQPSPMEAPIIMIPRVTDVPSAQGGLIPVGATSEWDSQSAKVISISGEAVAIFKTPEGFRACQDTCPHAGGSLGEGSVQNGVVTCPLHGWQFNLKNGECLNERGNSIRVFDAEVKEGKVCVKP